jgi:ABC-2 type transport system ATP-binding protein
MIQVEALSRFYGDHQAVNGVSFRIDAHEVVGFLGLNGAGKTTMLMVLAGLLPPSSGTVIIDGVDLETAGVDFRARIGFLPETPPLHLEMTVTEFLHFVGALRGMEEGAIGFRIGEVVALCQLGGQEHRVIGELSHGFRKRVGIAQAIIHSPKLVILDEPISGLDPVQIVEMRGVIRGLAQSCTVLISSHILSEISQTCDRLLVLNDGQLVAQGTEEELAARREGGVVLDLVVTGQTEAVTALLDARPEVTGHELISAQDGRVECRVRMLADDREVLVSGLVGAGFGLRRLAEAHGELEEIFLGLAGALGAEAGGDGTPSMEGEA